jgi:hypothetical protein
MLHSEREDPKKERTPGNRENAGQKRKDGGGERAKERRCEESRTERNTMEKKGMERK